MTLKDTQALIYRMDENRLLERAKRILTCLEIRFLKKSDFLITYLGRHSILNVNC
jgi:hypothetical protein